MLSKDINVEAFLDDEARVWVASSNDVPGLISEADTRSDRLKFFGFSFLNDPVLKQQRKKQGM